MTEDEIPGLPVIRNCPMGVPALYRRLRATRPVSRARMPYGELVWLVTSYDLSRRILADPRVSADRANPGFPSAQSPQARQVERDAIEAGRRSMLTADAPVHGAHRRMLAAEFTPQRVSELRPGIQEIVDQCVDCLLGAAQPADLVEHVSLPVPALVVCQLLGVPSGKRGDFQHWTRKLLAQDTPAAEMSACWAALSEFLDQLVRLKEDGDPGKDTLGRLISGNRRTGAMTHDEVVANAMLLLVAGHETTAQMISLGVAALLENPGQRERLTADPSLLPAAVEELLRYYSVVDGVTWRVAQADIRLGDVTIQAGDGIVVSPMAADWDDTVFGRPELLDFRRQGRGHIAFGYGAHQCLGQHLARVELGIVYATLFRRVPGLNLAVPLAELPYRTRSSVYGIDRMPVTY